MALARATTRATRTAARPALASRSAAGVRAVAMFGLGQKQATAGAESPFYSFKLKDIDGKPYDMKQLKGKVVLVVHTATACGLTPQFGGLQALVDDYGRKGLVVLGQPCNQFGGQNPEGDAATKRHAVSNFGFTGTMLSKADVNGPDASPLFDWLRAETTGLLGSDFKWNFSKVLVGKDGRVVKRYAPTATPESLKGDIEAALAA
jgi:glutathione peroxidase